MDEQDRGNYDPIAQPGRPADSEQADYEAAAQAAANPDKGVPPDYHQDKGRGRKILLLAVGILVIAAASAATYWYFLREKTPAASKAQEQTTQKEQSKTAASKISTETKDYTSSNFNLAFSYPEDWEVADNGAGVLSVKSPDLTLKTPTGQDFTGRIVLTIRDKAQKLTEFDKGNATATRDSQKVAYTKPTQSQRGNTYLSFLQYASTTSAGGLDGIYITGDNGYQKGQAIPLVDIQKVDPVVSLTFVGSESKAASIAEGSWDDAGFAGPLKAMLQSLSIN